MCRQFENCVIGTVRTDGPLYICPPAAAMSWSTTGVILVASADAASRFLRSPLPDQLDCFVKWNYGEVGQGPLDTVPETFRESFSRTFRQKIIFSLDIYLDGLFDLLLENSVIHIQSSTMFSWFSSSL